MLCADSVVAGVLDMALIGTMNLPLGFLVYFLFFSASFPQSEGCTLPLHHQSGVGDPSEEQEASPLHLQVALSQRAKSARRLSA